VHRFLEEAIELAQASKCSREDAHALVDYVFSRPDGDKLQETGGVLVTLAALCSAQGIDMDNAGEEELRRNWSRIDKIRAKQAAKPKGTALPQ
jgi:NTP pyrophosphatase (non-canonical NTP hydrolase)